MYNPKSTKAEEFIANEEVLATLEYAKNNKNNIELIDKILEKAKLGKGLTHREAAVLLDCDNEEKNQEIHSGGSGCACCASVFSGYLFNQLKQKKLNKIITVTELYYLHRYIYPIIV